MGLSNNKMLFSPFFIPQIISLLFIKFMQPYSLYNS